MGRLLACGTLIECQGRWAPQTIDDALLSYKKGGGCGIHKKRPSNCSFFQCVWLTMDQMPDFSRLGRLGLINWA